MEKHQTYNEYVEKHFTAYRQKEPYSPIYFVSKDNADAEVFTVGSFEDKSDCRREVKVLAYSEITIDTLHKVEYPANEFVFALMEYLINNHQIIL